MKQQQHQQIYCMETRSIQVVQHAIVDINLLVFLRENANNNNNTEKS